MLRNQDAMLPATNVLDLAMCLEVHIYNTESQTFGEKSSVR